MTCNLTSTPQGWILAKDALITFCLTRVSCDIQIRQLINDIKFACALADMCTFKPWCDSHQYQLKPLPTFLHHFIMFGSSLRAYS